MANFFAENFWKTGFWAADFWADDTSGTPAAAPAVPLAYSTVRFQEDAFKSANMGRNLYAKVRIP